MKKVWFVVAVGLAALSAGGVAMADTSVRGYTRHDGTYVQPHVRSPSNSTTYDNYSTRGNTNPYTGQAGTHNPYGSGSSPYGSGGYGSSPNPYGTTAPGVPCYGLNCR